MSIIHRLEICSFYMPCKQELGKPNCVPSLINRPSLLPLTPLGLAREMGDHAGLPMNVLRISETSLAYSLICFTKAKMLNLSTCFCQKPRGPT